MKKLLRPILIALAFALALLAPTAALAVDGANFTNQGGPSAAYLQQDLAAHITVPADLAVQKTGDGLLVTGTPEQFAANTLALDGELVFEADAPVSRISLDGLAAKGTTATVGVYVDGAAKPVATFTLAHQKKKASWSAAGERTINVAGAIPAGTHTVKLGVQVTGVDEGKTTDVLLRDIEFVQGSQPVLYFSLNDDPEATYPEGFGTIDAMNASKDHSVNCEGTVSVVVPDGYVSDYGAQSSVSDLALDHVIGLDDGTWKADSAKKSYELSLAQERDLFGMGAGSNWVLLSNANDTSLARNRLSYWLGAELSMAYTAQCVPVDVVMNGVYYGSYLLCEKISVANPVSAKGADFSRVDSDSALAFWWMQVVSKNANAFAGQSYLYKNGDKLNCGPLGTFDTAWSGDAVVDFSSPSSKLTKKLQADAAFGDKAKAYWNDTLKAKLVEASKDGGVLDRYYDEQLVSWCYDQERMAAAEADSVMDKTYRQEIDALKQWIRDMIASVDGAFGEAVAEAPDTEGAEDGEDAPVKATANSDVKATKLFFRNYHLYAYDNAGSVENGFTTTPDNAGDKEVAFASSDDEVATVGSDGKVTVVGAGECAISGVLASGAKNTYRLTVVDHSKDAIADAQQLKLSTTKLTVGVNTYGQVRVVDSDKPAKAGELKFASSDQTIATVDANGVVKGIKLGTAKVTVTDSASGTEATCDVTVAEPTYTFKVDGGKPSWAKGTKTGLTLVVNRNFDDDQTYSLFKKVAIDGEKLDIDEFKAESGSLRLTISADYLQDLDKGNHEVKVTFKDGTAKTTLAIEKANKNSSTKSSSSSAKKLAKTEDLIVPGVLVAIAVVSGIALVVSRLASRSGSKRGKHRK